MARKSKEEDILKLFFNQPSKQWHFSKIKEKIPISDSKISKWLKKFQKEKLILKTKKKGKMPYYIGNYRSPEYINTKKIYGMNMLHKSRFLNHLRSLRGAKTIILFGSFSTGDWYEESDIDLFIYGETEGFEQGKYESKLGKEIQLFTAKNRKDFEKIGTRLIKNIIRGDIIKGELDFIKVSFNA
ncbi:MAG: nucleotidyltransferase domain-containing protein [DPANN group archaeon]|nr:nucleotidyltransferase domain-containing protein [DPANN group archaeon]